MRAVHLHYLHEQSCKMDDLERAVGTTSSEIVEVRGALHKAESALYVNFLELREEVVERLETQRKATEVIKTAERELQGKTWQDLAVHKEALRREQARREKWERTLHGELATDARRQDPAIEAPAAGVAQHEVLLQGAAGAMDALQNSGAEQAAALARPSFSATANNVCGVAPFCRGEKATATAEGGLWSGKRVSVTEVGATC